MAKTLLVMLLFITTTAQGQQISNCGLEHWQIGTGAQKPDSFFTTDELIPSNTCIRTTDAHSGQYAAIVTNNGILAYGQLPLGDSIIGGWPFTYRPSALKFWYKFNQSHTDSALVWIYLAKWVNDSMWYVGGGMLAIPTAVANYTEAVIPMTYLNSLQPDSILIVFIPNFSQADSNELYVDDLLLEYPAELPTPSSLATKEVCIYPNPGSDMINIAVRAGEKADVEIWDMTGKKIFDQKDISGLIKVDCSLWDSGVYFVRFIKNGSVYSDKFIKE